MQYILLKQCFTETCQATVSAVLFTIQQKTRHVLLYIPLLFLKKNLILWRLCTSIQILSSCLTPGFSLSISHSSRCKVFLQVLNMSNPCRSVCFYHVVYVVITDGSTSLSILLCTSFYFECCQTLCEQNAFFFFFLFQDIVQIK